MKPIFLLTILLVIASPVDNARARTKEDRFARVIEKRATHVRNEPARKAYARAYAKRILLESKRRNLDPVAMVVVAWIESDFRESAKRTEGSGVTSYGVWQIIPSDFSSRWVRKILAGCKPPPKLKRWRLYNWKRRMKGARCEDQTIANRRIMSGRLSAKELRDHIISTYVAHFEMRAHVDASYKRREKPRLIKYCKLSRKTQYMLYRMAHYNSGPKRPLKYYLRKLCKRYEIIKAETKVTKIEGGK